MSAKLRPARTLLAVVVLEVVGSGPKECLAANPATPKMAQCPRDELSALSEIACEVARQLGGSGDGAEVVAASPTAKGERDLRDAKGLGERIASVTAGRLGRGARPAAGVAPLTEARTLASRRGRLVHLVTTLEAGAIRVRADVYPIARDFWDRVRNTNPAPTAHAFAERRIDAEIAAFLQPIPLTARRFEKNGPPPEVPVALACGDLELDGTLELVVIGRQRVTRGRLRSRRFEMGREQSWSELSSISATPLRQPIAAAFFTGRKGVVVGTTDRASALRLNPELLVEERLAGIVPWPAMGCLARSEIALGAPVPCEPGTTAAPLTKATGDIDALASGRVIAKDGGATRVIAWRDASNATVTLSDDRRRSVRVDGVGAQLALGDLDLDGQIELISSINTLNPTEDALVVHTWLDGGEMRERFRMAVATGIRAIAVCPPESGDSVLIALATGDGLWIAR